jgi:hypothetical protein
VATLACVRLSIVPFLYSKCTAAARSPGVRVMDDRPRFSRRYGSTRAVEQPTYACTLHQTVYSVCYVFRVLTVSQMTKQ